MTESSDDHRSDNGLITTVPSFTPKQVTREDVLTLASWFDDQRPHIQRVEIFGSFARGDQTPTSDLDMILCADEATALAWLDRLDIEADMYWNMREARYAATALILDFGPKRLAYLEPWKETLDLFVFPPNWRSRLRSLQKYFPNEENFMQDVAHDALQFTRSFARPGW